MNIHPITEQKAVLRAVVDAIADDAPALLQLLVSHYGISVETKVKHDTYGAKVFPMVDHIIHYGGPLCLQWLYDHNHLSEGRRRSAVLEALLSELWQPPGHEPDFARIERSARGLIASGALPSVAALGRSIPFQTRFSKGFVALLVPSEAQPGDIAALIPVLEGYGGFDPPVNCLPFLDQLCLAGADPSFIDAKGRGAMHYAVQSNRLDVCRWLFDHGVNPWQQTCAKGHKPRALSLELRGTVKQKAEMKSFLRAARANRSLARAVAKAVIDCAVAPCVQSTTARARL